jgi:hypothetical protein
MILLSLLNTGFVDYGQKCTVRVIGLGGKFIAGVTAFDQCKSWDS